MSEGYTAWEVAETFPGHVENAIEYITTQHRFAFPYTRYKKFFNFYQIDLISEQSGIDIPEQGHYVNTALDGEDAGGRLGTVSWEKSRAVIQEAENILQIYLHWCFAILNSNRFANSGGFPCVFSYPNYDDIALHEAGHSFHDLDDEYFGGGATYTGDEPNGINVTKDPTGAKWAHWIGYEQPVVGTIGVYEGAYYHSYGAYRPSENSKMGWAPAFYNIVCIEKVILDIYDIVDPADSWLDNENTLTNPENLWVEVIDPEVVLVDWYLGDQLVEENGGETFSIREHLTEPGNYEIRAHVYDEVVIRSYSDNQNPHILDLVRTDLEKLQQDITWQVNITSAMKTRHQKDPNVGLAVDSRNNLSLSLSMAQEISISLYTMAGDRIMLLNTQAREGLNLFPITPEAAGIHLVKIVMSNQSITRRVFLGE
jgi:hypothetical protein